MAVPNQNNINDIITSKVKDVNSIINVIIDAASSKIIKRAASDIESLNAYKTIVDATLGKDSVVTAILSAGDKLHGMQIPAVHIRKIKKGIASIVKLANYISRLGLFADIESLNAYKTIIDYMFGKDGVVVTSVTSINALHGMQIPAVHIRKIKKGIASIVELANYISRLELFATTESISKVQEILKPILSLYIEAAYTLNAINDLDLPSFINVKIWFIKRSLKNTLELIFFMKRINILIPLISISKLSLKILLSCINIVSSIFEAIRNTPVALITRKLNRIIKSLTHMLTVITILGIVSRFVSVFVKIKDILMLSVTFKTLVDVFENIKALKAGIFTIAKLNRINIALTKIKLIIWNINKIHVRPKHILKMMLLKSLFVNVGILFTTIALISPIVLILTPVLAILILGILALKIATTLIVKILGNMATFSVIKGLLFMTLVLLFYVSLASMLLVIALMSKPILKSVLTLIPVLAILVLAILALKIATTHIVKMLRNMATFSVIKGLRSITLVLLFYVSFTSMLLVIALMSKPILKSVLTLIPVLAILILGILALKIATTLIVKILEKMVTFSVIKGLQSITLILFFYVSLASMLLVIALISKPIVKSILSILGLFGVILLVTTATIGIGMLMSLLTPIILPTIFGLTMIIIIIGIIALIALALKVVENIELDKELINERIKTIFDTVKMIINTIFAPDETESNESDKSWIATIIDFIGGTLSSIIKAIMAVAFLAVMVVAVMLILLIAGQLKLLEMIELNETIISTNVNIVLETALSVVNNIFNRKDDIQDNPSNKGFFGKLFSYVGSGLVKIVEVIMAVAFLAVSIIAITLILFIAKELNALQKIDLKSEDIYKNVDTVIGTAQRVVNNIFNRKDNTPEGEGNENKKGLLSKVISGIGEGVNFISKLGWLSTALISIGMVGQLAEHLNTINNLPDLSNIDSKVAAISSASDKIISSFTASNNAVVSEHKLNLIKRIIKIFSNASIDSNVAENSKKVLDNYIDLVKEINTIDYKKLETSAKMFEAMAKFSTNINGNFEKLAETINEDLMPALEELKEIMGIIPEKLDVGFQNTSASIGAAAAPMTNASAEAQIRRENPTNIDEGFINKLVQQRMNEKAKADANGVATKLDELISLLKGYGGNKVIVKTV